MRRVLPVLLALALAGCLAPAAEESLAPAAVGPLWDEVRALALDLPCEAEVGDGTSANLRVVAEDALDDAGATTHGELDVRARADGRALAAVARYGTGGADFVDVADPLRPLQMGSWDPETPDRGLDVKLTSDGLTAVVAGDRSIKLVDVRDPAAPRLESETPLAKKQAHMVTVFRVAGDEWVAAAKAEGKDLVVWRVAGEPGSRTLERAADVKLTALGEAGDDLTRSHDAWFHVDAKSGVPTLWVANVWEGVVALDVSDPRAPKEIARIPNADPYQGYTHTVQVTFVEGRRLVVAVQEVGANALKVWDATDVAHPRLVALWHVPVAAKPQHNLQLVGERAYVAHYGDGTFVFDLREIRFDAPRPTLLSPVARLEAASGPNPTGGGLASAFGGTWDVVVHGGVLWTSEIDAGLRATAYGCLWPGDPAASSTG